MAQCIAQRYKYQYQHATTRKPNTAIPPNPQKQKGQPLRGQPLVVPRPPRERGGVIGLGC